MRSYKIERAQRPQRVRPDAKRIIIPRYLNAKATSHCKALPTISSARFAIQTTTKAWANRQMLPRPIAVSKPLDETIQCLDWVRGGIPSVSCYDDMVCAWEAPYSTRPCRGSHSDPPASVRPYAASTLTHINTARCRAAKQANNGTKLATEHQSREGAFRWHLRTSYFH